MSTATRLFGPMRVPFLALTLSCVLLGVAAARHADAAFAWPLAAVALLAALAAHVSVNAFNEYLDFRSGLDATTRRTPVRAANLVRAELASWVASVACAAPSEASPSATTKCVRSSRIDTPTRSPRSTPSDTSHSAHPPTSPWSSP
jgi:heme O synthase-like polyprenyltransferase